jgi:hypothetical protein
MGKGRSGVGRFVTETAGRAVVALDVLTAPLGLATPSGCYRSSPEQAYTPDNTKPNQAYIPIFIESLFSWPPIYLNDTTPMSPSKSNAS